MNKTLNEPWKTSARNTINCRTRGGHRLPSPSSVYPRLKNDPTQKELDEVYTHPLVANCLIFYNVFSLTHILHEYMQEGNVLDENVLEDLSAYLTFHEAKDELRYRTPSYRGWKQKVWLSHCGDYCTFIDCVGGKEIRPLLDDPILFNDVRESAEEVRLIMDEFLDSMHKDGWHVGYLSRCLKCGHYRLYHDFS
jgi:hypothetical protein